VERSQEVYEHFAEILMNVIDIKDLYEAWENMYQNTIEGFTTPTVRNTNHSPILGRESVGIEGRLDHIAA
jgi:hypothetical protein